MSTITQEQQTAIADYLATHVLPKGLGTAEAACSIAAINLALTGRLTDTVPDCMSPVIVRWIIRVQDAMPGDMRNSAQWKALLPLAAGTGRDASAEKRRLKIILDWMWKVVLPHLQPMADAGGLGEAWKHMTDEKTAAAAAAAAYAADAYAYAAAAYAADAADAAATYATYAAYATTTYAADAAAYAAAYADADAYTWKHFNPCAVLAQLVEA
jgi:hypothetical protein